MEKQKIRDSKIDLVKALGIVLMVFYHASSPGRDFVYLFHMALFFICSGYCYSHKAEQTPLEYIKKKIISLYLPCFISGVIVACLQNILLDIHIYSYETYSKLTIMGWLKQVVKCIGFGGGHQMLGANWFFRTLFFSSIMYMLLNKLLGIFIYSQNKLLVVRAIICMTMTSIGGFLGVKLSLGKYFNCLTVMVLLDIGFLMKELCVLKFLNATWQKLLCIVVAAGILLICNSFGTISINSNNIIDPIFFILCSIAGFTMIYSISGFLELSFLKQSFVFIGQNTIWIMFFHYVGFKLVTLCEIIILHEPIDNLSAYPCHHTEQGMWAVYGICGVIVPVLFIKMGSSIQNILSKKEMQDQK